MKTGRTIRWAAAIAVGISLLGLDPSKAARIMGAGDAAARADTTEVPDSILSPAQIRQRLGYAVSRADNAEPHLRAAVEHFRVAEASLNYWIDHGFPGEAAPAETVTIQPAKLRVPFIGVAPPDSLPWIFDSDRFARDEGALKITFRVDTVGPAQGIVSRDHRGYGQGGHLSVWLRADTLIYRLQSTDRSRVLRAAPIRADSVHRVIVGWGPDGQVLYLDEHLVGWHPGFAQGTTPTDRRTVIGGLCSRCEAGTYDPDSPFQGEIEKVEGWASYRDVDRALPEGSPAGPWIGNNDTTTSAGE